STYKEWLFSIFEEELTNAKELFYTLENVQVDCRELTEDQIKEMCNVYESNGYKQWVHDTALKIEDNFTYLRLDQNNEFYITGKLDAKTTITYEKFMELFGEPKYEVTMIAEKPKEFQNLVESLNEELTEEAYKETKPQHYSKGI